MNLRTAKKHVALLRLLGATLMCVSFLFITTGALKAVYAVLTSAPDLGSINANLANLIHVIYVKTPCIDWIWRAAPTPDMLHLNSEGNFGFLLCMSIGFIGRKIWDSASELKAAIAKALRDVQSRKWERELNNDQTSDESAEEVNVNITVMPSSEDEWYKRPTGLLLLGVAIAALGQWVNLQLGLAK